MRRELWKIIEFICVENKTNLTFLYRYDYNKNFSILRKFTRKVKSITLCKLVYKYEENEGEIELYAN